MGPQHGPRARQVSGSPPILQQLPSQLPVPSFYRGGMGSLERLVACWKPHNWRSEERGMAVGLPSAYWEAGARGLRSRPS